VSQGRSDRARLTAAVIAQDEERHIAACLRSLEWADERLVVDGGSADRTAELARAAGARVVVRRFDDFGRQRQAAIEAASCDWVLFVDADERVSAGLAAEVRCAVAAGGPDAPSGYWIARRNYIWGRWIRGGGWWPDAQLRLLRRGAARYAPERPVHEVAAIDGPVGRLRCALVHYNYETVGQFVGKQRRYARLEARRRIGLGEPGRPRRLLSAPVREARRRLIEERGFVDGQHGAALAALTALSALETQLYMLRRG
jgi:glycosyltransferase involved in cell wall biosynthesis